MLTSAKHSWDRVESIRFQKSGNVISDWKMRGQNNATLFLVSLSDSKCFAWIELSHLVMPQQILWRSHCTKNWRFSLRICSENVTKFTVFCGFGGIYWRNSQWKLSFFYIASYRFSKHLFIHCRRTSYRFPRNCSTAEWISYPILFPL